MVTGARGGLDKATPIGFATEGTDIVVAARPS